MNYMEAEADGKWDEGRDSASWKARPLSHCTLGFTAVEHTTIWKHDAKLSRLPT
jgi:hypothetical protein